MNKIQGIIINMHDVREADRVVTAYSKECGKIDLIAKGIRKINAKLKSGLEMANVVDIWYVEGRRYPIITDVLLKDDFALLKGDPERLSHVLETFAFFDKAVRGHERDEHIWDLIWDTLSYLKESDVPRSDFSVIFRIQLISRLGFRPQLEVCISCEDKVSLSHTWFSLGGGVVCGACASSFETEPYALTPQTFSFLRSALEEQVSHVPASTILGPSERRDFEKLINDFTAYVLE